MIRRSVMLLALAGVMLLPVGCHTVEGFGRDVSAAGDTVSHTARETRESLEID